MDLLSSVVFSDKDRKFVTFPEESGVGTLNLIVPSTLVGGMIKVIDSVNFGPNGSSGLFRPRRKPAAVVVGTRYVVVGSASSMLLTA